MNQSLGRVFGRKVGRSLGPEATARLALARQRFGLPWLAQAPPHSVDAQALGFAAETPLWLEAGFGSGETLVGRARAEPATGFVGCEVWRQGVAAFAREALAGAAVGGAAEAANLRLFEGDARLALRAMASGSLTGAAALFSDPWPKPRHAERRLPGAVFMAEVARALRVGGTLWVATDIEILATWALSCAAREPGLAFAARRAQDWRTRPPDWPITRYEAKALRAGRKPIWLRFLRVALRARAC